MERDRAALTRRVAKRVETVAWAWTYGNSSDAVFERLIAALASSCRGPRVRARRAGRRSESGQAPRPGPGGELDRSARRRAAARRSPRQE